MEEILIEIKDRIAWVTINRPQVSNALTRVNKQQLLDFFRAANTDHHYDVVIIRGSGDRSFCAGTDLRDMGTFTPVDAEGMLTLESELNTAIRACSKPVIAAIGGHALGGGLLMALMCDYSVVCDQARLGFPEIKAGLPASIEIAIIHRFVGLARARSMIYFGNHFSPDEALQMGLINEVVPQADVYHRSEEIARSFMALSPTALRLQKELIKEWIDSDFNSAVKASIYVAALSFTTGEPQKAIASFLAKKNKG